jgi:hypothetical protein
MEESIFLSIKKLLGISSDNEDFDEDIKIHINSVLMILDQIGIESITKNFIIEDGSETWSDYLTDIDKFSAVKSYIYLKVKLLFDPPLNSSVLESNKEVIKELEWRLNIESEED